MSSLTSPACPRLTSVSVDVTIEAGLDIRCASLAGLTVLKLVAWRIRHPTTPKDGQDLALLLEASHSGLFEDECWGDETALQETDYNIYRTGPYRLGAQIRGQFRPDSVKQLRELLDSDLVDRLLVDMPRGAVARREQLAALALGMGR